VICGDSRMIRESQIHIPNTLISCGAGTNVVGFDTTPTSRVFFEYSK
jgi:hypothetical protein